MGAAARAVRLEFRAAEKTFLHRMSRDVDEERAKVTSDLDFAGRLVGQALIERPTAPRTLDTAAGDQLRTDGAMAVLVLR